jgi:hypothetical protein
VSDVRLFSRGDRSRRPIEPDDDGLDHGGSAQGTKSVPTALPGDRVYLELIDENETVGGG